MTNLARPSSPTEPTGSRASRQLAAGMTSPAAAPLSARSTVKRNVLWLMRVLAATAKGTHPAGSSRPAGGAASARAEVAATDAPAAADAAAARDRRRAWGARRRSMIIRGG